MLHTSNKIIQLTQNLRGFLLSTPPIYSSQHTKYKISPLDHLNAISVVTTNHILFFLLSICFPTQQAIDIQG